MAYCGLVMVSANSIEWRVASGVSVIAVGREDAFT
jgi:hypothetical protein